MDYIKKLYVDTAVEAQISSFSVEGGTTEYQVILSNVDPLLSFSEQMKNILETYIYVVEKVVRNDAVAVFRRYFVSDASNQTSSIVGWECENNICPFSIVQQPPLNGTKIAIWTYLLTGMEIRTYNSDLLGAAHNGYKHFWIGGAHNEAENSEYQTRLLLNDYIMQLIKQHCTLAMNCIRTWFFVQNVDVNYAGMVKARKEVFITQNLTEKTHYIASTGIEGRHADPSVLVQMDSYAIEGLDPKQIQFLYAPSHLNFTYEYGVTFERGTAVLYGDRKQIFISGTASIDNQGEILYPNDVQKQAERMMDNISALLKEAGAGVNDITQSVTYLRDAADYQTVDNFFKKNYPNLPHLIVLASVCRPGWLIETECMAVIKVHSDFVPF